MLCLCEWMPCMLVPHRDQPEEGIGSPETGVPVSGPVWMLGNELGSPARAVRALNYWAFSAVPESGGFMLQDEETWAGLNSAVHTLGTAVYTLIATALPA